MRTCETEGCGRKHYARGLCRDEYRKGWRAKTLPVNRQVQVRQPVQADGRRVCTVPGCDRNHYGRGLCRPHHQRVTRTGSLRPDVPIERRWFGQYSRPAAPPPRPAPRRTFDAIDTDEL